MVFEIKKTYKIRVKKSEVILSEDEMRKLYSIIGKLIEKEPREEVINKKPIAETARGGKIYKVDNWFIFEDSKRNFKRVNEKLANKIVEEILLKLREIGRPVTIHYALGRRISGEYYPVVRYLLESRNDILKVGRKFMLKPGTQSASQPTPQTI